MEAIRNVTGKMIAQSNLCEQLRSLLLGTFLPEDQSYRSGLLLDQHFKSFANN